MGPPAPCAAVAYAPDLELHVHPLESFAYLDLPVRSLSSQLKSL
jgi:hypothetical protein